MLLDDETLFRENKLNAACFEDFSSYAAFRRLWLDILLKISQGKFTSIILQQVLNQTLQLDVECVPRLLRISQFVLHGR